jgi:hypothetical protein
MYLRLSNITLIFLPSQHHVHRAATDQVSLLPSKPTHRAQPVQLDLELAPKPHMTMAGQDQRHQAVKGAARHSTTKYNHP